MATLLKIKKEGELTPEYIEGKLFSFYDIAQGLSGDAAKAIYLLTLT